MKNAKLILLFLLTVFIITASAQNYYQQEDLDELETVFDTLPNGTIIDLMEGTIVETTTSPPKLKSAVKKGRTDSRLPGRNKRQISGSSKDRLKSVQLIKSLNQETSSYYLEKLDSIITYEPTMVPGFDSVLVEGEKRILKFNENGYVIEAIVDTLDKSTGTYLKKEKVEYTLDEEGRLLKRLTYNWTGEVWAISQKHEQEYNASGDITLSVDKFWGGSDWLNSSKIESEFDANGNRTLFASYITDESGEWKYQYKREYTYHANGEVATYNYFSFTPQYGLSILWTGVHKLIYNETGQTTFHTYEMYNVATQKLEYEYKYEYEYLEDGSTLEIKYNWNIDTQEFFENYQKRYKYERQYENDNLVEEVKLNFVNESWKYEYKIEREYQDNLVVVEIKSNFRNENWEYEYKIERKYDKDKLTQEIRYNYGYDGWQENYRKEYEYDQWGREILYELYDADWWGEITERRIQLWTETGERVKIERCRWEFDEEFGYFRKVGVGFNETIKDAEGKTLSYNYYKWNEEREEWMLDWKDYYRYLNEGETIRERYSYHVDGYHPTFEQDYVTILTYNNAIGKYSGFSEKNLYYDEEYETRITYNEDLKVDEMLYVEEGIIEEKIKCYYDALGRDTAWYDYNWVEGQWQLHYKVLFTYEDMGNGHTKITENWQSNSQYDSDNYSIYIIKEGRIMEMYDQRYSSENGELVPIYDTTTYQYNALGQLTSILEGYDDHSWKTDYQIINDTLIVEYLYGGNSDTTDWIQGEREVYKVDPNFSKNQFQQIPAVVFEGYQYAHEWHSIFDYGKILEGTNYGRDYNTKELEMYSKSVFYYSPASPLQGEAIINGYIFDETGTEKSVSITNQISGDPLDGVAVSLCAKENDFVLAADSTDVDGFYEFKGVPVGNFYIKVELEGYEQTSTYNIVITPDTSKIENKNFIVLDGEVVTGIAESKSDHKIYPNPASNNVNISTSTEITTVKVMDISGRIKFYKKDINSRHVNIDTERLPKGIYIFEIRTSSSLFIEKIIVER